jgi:anti-sigma B factor antagonist
MMVITREQAGTTLVISLHGKLDTAAAPAVEAEIRKGLSGVKKLCWNFEDLDYLTSAGFRVLLIAESMLDDDAEMKVYHANDIVKNAFNLINLTYLLARE